MNLTRATFAFSSGTIALLAGGCSGPQTPLRPASPEAAHVAALWWLFFGVCMTVFILVLAWLLFVIFRRNRPPLASLRDELPVHEQPDRDRRMTRLVGSAIGATAIILFALLLADFSVGRALHPPARGDALTIKVTGRQWWWQFEYQDRQADRSFITANELHLPLGRPVQLLLQSSDVIHSFWIPSLQGKRDLVPGHQTALWITPDRAGTYRGQCAEFCGYQHAHMGLVAVVETPEEFARWQEAQRKSAPPPTTDSQRLGQQIFLTRTCAMCHAIQGTPANSRVGPPLTHLASQQTIAAGTFPNTRGHLAGWILDAPSLKPGVRMPPNPLAPDELYALLDYLAILK
jgi:cytochrome c oxidase subunit II